MPRIKRGQTTHRRKKKILKAAKGYRGARSKQIRCASEALLRAGRYAYRDRKVKKREFRKLWITRINAAVRSHDLSYSQFMRGLKLGQSDLDRKMLAMLAVERPGDFSKVVNFAKDNLS